MEVSAANGARFDTDEQFRRGDSWHRNIAQSKRYVSLSENHGAHVDLIQIQGRVCQV